MSRAPNPSQSPSKIPSDSQSLVSVATVASAASTVSGSIVSRDSVNKSKRRVTFPVLDEKSSMARDILIDLLNQKGVDKRKLAGIDGRVVGDSGTDENDSGASLETECLLVKFQRTPRKLLLGLPVVDLFVVTISVILLMTPNILLLKLIVIYLQRRYYLYAAYTVTWMVVGLVVTGLYRFRRRSSKARHGKVAAVLCKLLRLISFTDPLFLAVTWLKEAEKKKGLKYHVKDRRKGQHNRHWLAQRVISANTYAVSQLKVSCLIAATTYSWQVIGLLSAVADPFRMNVLLTDISLKLCVVTCVISFCWAMVVNLPRRRTHLMVEDGFWIATFGTMKYLWLFFFILSRVLAYYLFSQAFHLSLFYACLASWVLVYTTMIFYSPPASRNRFLSLGVYKPLLASLYLLGFVNAQRGYLENAYGFFYMGGFLFNLCLMYMALEGNGGGMTWVMVSVAAFLMGFVVMITDVVLRLRVRHQRIDVEIVIDDVN